MQFPYNSTCCPSVNCYEPTSNPYPYPPVYNLNLNGGLAGEVVFQAAPSVTAFTAQGQVGQLLQSNYTGSPTWISPSDLTTGDLFGGVAGQLPIQTAPSTTGFIYPNDLQITATGSTAPRTLANRFADVANVKDFGAVGDGITDDTIAIQAAINSNKPVYLPEPSNFYKITGYLIFNSTSTMYGDGIGTRIKMIVPAPYYVQPAIIVMQTAPSTLLENFSVDHDGTQFTTTTTFLPALVAGAVGDARGCALLIMGNKSIISKLNVLNGWDCGIGIGNYQIFTTGSQAQGPDQVLVNDCKTYNCGCGYHAYGGAPNGWYHQGAGVNFLTASNFICSDCTDYGSYGGFWADTNGGGYGSFVNCNAEENPYSPICTPSQTGAQYKFQPSGSTGWLATWGGMSFYSGTYNVEFSNCTSKRSGLYGMVLDTFSSSNLVSNFTCIESGLNGFIDAGVNNYISSMSLNGCGISVGITINGSTAPATASFSARGPFSFGGTSSIIVNNLNITGTPVYPAQSSTVSYNYAVEAVPLGSTYKAIRLFGGNFVSGTVGIYNINANCFLTGASINSTAFNVIINGNTPFYVTGTKAVVNSGINLQLGVTDVTATKNATGKYIAILDNTGATKYIPTYT